MLECRGGRHHAVMVPSSGKSAMSEPLKLAPPHLNLTSALQFMDWARGVCDRLAAAGHWCDYIDPCSGLPVRCE